MKMRLSMWLLLIATSVAAMGCHRHHLGGYNLPPAERLMHPGPGVGGPGPGVLAPAPVMPMMAHMAPMVSSQVLFAKPEGMQIRWDLGGVGHFDSEPLIAPGRQNFPQGAIYRLKLTNIPAREGVELYPTLEIGTATPRTEAFLAHNAIPVQFTEEDFDQVLTGNFVTKVIYLPDPEFQELALAGVETLVSTRLDPGLDPIVEADRRGSILAILRIGNKDVEMLGDEMGEIIHAGLGASGAIGPDGVALASANVPAGQVMPAGHHLGMRSPMMVTTPVLMAGPHDAGLPPAYVAGVTAPDYGMPMSGTPIGLPGPPHIPLGGPAGLQKHVIKNHTHMHIPSPTEKVRLDVKQEPGMSYPTPVNKAWIHERVFTSAPHFHQPLGNKFEPVH